MSTEHRRVDVGAEERGDGGARQSSTEAITLALHEDSPAHLVAAMADDVVLELGWGRLIFGQTVPTAAQPTIAILAAPASLSLAGYLTVNQQPTILLVGLLGVASLIPVGKFEVQRGAKIDRAAACDEWHHHGGLRPRRTRPPCSGRAA